MSRVDHGTVELEVDGKEIVLKPTLKAYQRINRRFGGLRQAIEACHNMDAESVCEIVSAGAGLNKDEAKELPQAVFNEGLMKVLPSATEYLMLLLNPTGKDDEPAEPEDSSGED